MAVLSAPTNTPTTTGASLGCSSDDGSTGFVYMGTRTGRAWYSKASGDSDLLVAQDQSEMLGAIGNTPFGDIIDVQEQAASVSPAETLSGLDVDSGPYFIGWVQTD